LKSSKDLNTYPWPDPEDIDYSSIIESRKYLPKGMIDATLEYGGYPISV